MKWRVWCLKFDQFKFNFFSTCESDNTLYKVIDEICSTALPLTCNYMCTWSLWIAVLLHWLVTVKWYIKVSTGFVFIP